MKITKVLFGAVIVATLGAAAFSPTVNADDTSKSFTIKINSIISGDAMMSDGATYELQKIENGAITTVSEKSSNVSGEISFDTLSFAANDSSSHFYRIIQKDGVAGLSTDKKIVYVRIVPSKGLLAYQDDTVYKTVNDGSGPHPFNATDEELQGQAYVEWDPSTKVLTFFRDDEGKYENGQQVDGKYYYTNFEKSTTGSTNRTWDSNYSISDECVKVVFRDAIRPEGKMDRWFYNYKELVEADIAKLDTSRATTLAYFFNSAEKLEKIDITKLDFTMIAQNASSSYEVLDYFMSWVPGVEEFDFNNYAKISERQNRFMAGMLKDSGLRYLNTTSLNHEGTSAEFSNLECLERAVVGEDYSFYRSSVTTSDDNWLKIETNKIDRFSRHMQTATGGPIKPESAGNYVRPICNTTPATFTSVYKKPIESPEEKTKNPDTADYAPAAALLLGASSFVAFFVFRAKRR